MNQSKKIYILVILCLPLIAFADPGYSTDYLEIGGIRTMSPTSADTYFVSDLECELLDTAAVDIVFCMDTSNSLDPYLDDLYDEMAYFIDNLEAGGYDYRLGGVTFDDVTNIWDFDPSTPGYQMTANDAEFESWLDGTGGNHWSSDLNEVSLDAICDAIRDYDWREDALHIVIMFTNEGYHYDGDGSGWSDETYPGTRSLVLSTGTIVFVAASSRPWPSTPIPDEHLENFQELADTSGGQWYPMTTDWDVILDDVVALISTFTSIAANIVNETGGTHIINAELLFLDEGCVTITTSNPVSSDSPVSDGDTEYFYWRMVIDSSCYGIDRCFDIRVWGGGYEDTIYGCVSDDSCFGYTDVSFSHTPPSLTAGCTAVYPTPFTISQNLTNDGTRPASNVNCYLDLSSCALSYAGGDANPKYIEELTYMGGTGSSSWQVNAHPSIYGTTQCYDIEISYSEGDPIVQNYCIDIPNLLESPTLTVWADDDLICEGSSTTLHSDVSTSRPWNYNWTPGTGLSDSTSPNPTASPTVRTIYTLNIDDGVDCRDNASVVIDVSPFIDVDAGDDVSTYAGGSVLLGGRPTGCGGTGSLSYNWTPTTGLDNPNVANPRATPLTTTTYTVTVEDGVGCSNNDAITVTVRNALGHIHLQGNDGVMLLRVVDTLDAINARNGVIMIEMPDGTIGAADMVDTLDTYTSPIFIRTPFGIRSWRKQIP